MINNIYIHRAVAASPTVQTSPAVDTTYTGKLVLLIDVPPGTVGLQINRTFLPSGTTGQPWCDLGAFVCGFAFPGNHFFGGLTTGNIELPDPGAAGRLVVGSFACANGDPVNSAKVTIQGQTQFAGTFAAELLDMGNQVPKLFQAPYNLSWLPGSFVASASAAIHVTASNWREIR